LAERGLLALLEPPYEPARLARAIDEALLRPPPPTGGIDLGGAAASARVLHDLIDRR
jgi:predicted glycosyltransferase